MSKKATKQQMPQTPETKPMPTVVDLASEFYGNLSGALIDAYQYADKLTSVTLTADDLHFSRESGLRGDFEICDIRDELDALSHKFYGAVERWKARHGLPHDARMTTL